MTVWRVVPSWPRYAVTRDGRIVDLSREQPATVRCHNLGYIQVSVTKLAAGGKLIHRLCYLHRLVAEAWLGPCPDGMEVNHIDGEKTNNAVDNLEYVTHAENQRHARDVLGRWDRETMSRGEDRPNSVLTVAAVLEIRQLYATGDYRHKDLAQMFGVSKPAIGAVTRGNTWAHVGGPIIQRQ